MDVALHNTGVRRNINQVSGAHLTELMETYPVRVRAR
jgi:hypothetical protein